MKFPFCPPCKAAPVNTKENFPICYTAHHPLFLKTVCLNQVGLQIADDIENIPVLDTLCYTGGCRALTEMPQATEVRFRL